MNRRLSEPEVTVPAHCRLGERTTVRVRAGRETVQVDELDLFGGTGLTPNPNQYALAALGACEATLRVEEHCAILDVFANSVPVETVLEVA